MLLLLFLVLLALDNVSSGNQFSFRANFEIQNVDCKFSFASYYQDNMVLQRAPQKSVIWGYGTVGASVSVTTNENKYTAIVEKRQGQDCGVWMVMLKPHEAGPSYDIQAHQDNKGSYSWLLLRNVLFGEVWVCGGQSNMEFTMTQIINSTEELNDVREYVNIRLFTASKIHSLTPLNDLQQIDLNWSLPTPETLSNGTFTYFSAVCWLYGKYLYQKINVPIGLVESCWGGTPVEAWSNTAALNQCGLQKFDPKKLPAGAADIAKWNSSVLWNAMIQPLVNMTIKGAIWYQGEANTEYHNAKYNCSFPAMISQWRESWHDGTKGQTDRDFPFGFVQLSDVVIKDDGSYPQIRWHQTADYGVAPNPRMPNTFMAVAMDLIDHTSPYGSIHPRYKQDVARRLVTSALSIVYKQSIVYDGPFPIEIYSTEKHMITVQYSKYQEIVVTDHQNFEICCSNSSCTSDDKPDDPNWFTVPIVSYTDHTVVLDGKVCTNKSLGVVQALRYAWAVTPCKFKACSVYNTNGLPANMFFIKLNAN